MKVHKRRVAWQREKKEGFRFGISRAGYGAYSVLEALKKVTAHGKS